MGKWRPEGSDSNGMNTWRAGCGGSRTSGSEGGPEKPTNGNVDRALRSDPYTELSTRVAFGPGPSHIDDMATTDCSRVSSMLAERGRGEGERADRIGKALC